MENLIDIVLWAFGGIGASALVYAAARFWENQQYESYQVSPGTSFETRSDFGSPVVEPLTNYFDPQPLNNYSLPDPTPQYVPPSTGYDILLDSVLKDESEFKPISIDSSIPELPSTPTVYSLLDNPDLNSVFRFNTQETNVSKWSDGTVGLADSNKFMYADPNMGLFIASIQDPDRVETKVTKKPGKVIVEYIDKDYNS